MNRRPAPRSLAGADLAIRVKYRERATGFWFLGVVTGIALVVAALAAGATGTTMLAIVGLYSLVAVVMAVRSAVLLARLGG
jgi:hypothetical protein